MVEQNFTQKTKQLIDNLKGICSDYGLGNSGDEFKIITQVFLYKFMNDKFGYEVKELDSKLKKADNWEEVIKKYSKSDYEFLLKKMSPDSARLYPDHFISTLWNQQNSEQFAKLFSDTLRDISKINNDVFSVKTEEGNKIQLFYGVDEYLKNFSEKQKDNFSKAIINQLVDVNFEDIFEQKFDFFSTIFEYLIKDYNKDGGGVYAEYYTPHAIAKIMASILVDKPVSNVTVYDPSAGSGTLLMNVAHAIGEDKCTIYSQDLSDKSSHLLRLNLILNNLVHSIHNIIQGNTIKDPYHRQGKELMKFDYIVSNPPFKLDFSNWREDIDTKENGERFFAGIPTVPKKKKQSMAIYLLFLQHIIYSLSQKGKSAVVVPTGFITAQNGIEKKIREELIDRKMLKGVISMPSNIFATTGTNVSVIFIDKENIDEKVVFMDASKMGEKIKVDGKNEKTVLSLEEEQEIVRVFTNKEKVDNFSVVVGFDEVKEKNYSFSTGQYFNINIEHIDISIKEFEEKINNFKKELSECFHKSKQLEDQIEHKLNNLKYE
ncbi:MAG: type I restriction-modification system subunit M [Candidatus Pacebacteria bacterium]|nr:type I restriction-modification system subunit M [Candidatus Paceibacterota bacterium]